jgi:hypothetical protein
LQVDPYPTAFSADIAVERFRRLVVQQGMKFACDCKNVLGVSDRRFAIARVRRTITPFGSVTSSNTDTKNS